ncbi:hypothetical protein BGW41_006907 [Actinomortierella wolfii]|nr:hypothetical protein BGW41_006907 [Actinomortierella wolfii]
MLNPRQEDIYRVAIVADPQLTDWFSYKQTGLALYLTELYTDLFMRRSFRQLRQQLRPDLVLFLGDLLDGGRETLDDERFQKNLRRFHTIFATEETDWGSRRSQRRRHINAQLSSQQQQQQQQQAELEAIISSNAGPESIREIRPGQFRLVQNIPTTVQERRDARRNDESARLYVAGNHDIGFGDTIIRETVKRFKRIHSPLNYEIRVGNHSFVILDTMSLSSVHQDIREEAQTFLDSLAAVYCGPQREQQHRMIVDERGEQYQNLISPELSREILEKLRPIMVFSGDDHDWCEIEHVLDDLKTNEVTVPTFSFAQGVQHPGFVLLSLYRPTDGMASLAGGSMGSDTGLPNEASFAYQHCGLPVQMAIYGAYIHLLLATLAWMVIYRFYWFWKGRNSSIRNPGLMQSQNNFEDYKVQAPYRAMSTATELSPTVRNTKGVFTLHFQNPPPIANTARQTTQRYKHEQDAIASFSAALPSETSTVHMTHTKISTWLWNMRVVQ